MYCMRCGSEMPDSLEYCTVCGNDLSSGKAALQADGTAAGQAGKQPAAPFGNVVPVDPAAAAGRDARAGASPDAASGKGIVPIVIAIAAVAALVVGAALFFAIGGSPDDGDGAAAPAAATAQDGGTSAAASSDADAAGGAGSAEGAPDDGGNEEPAASGPPEFDTLSTSSTLVGGTQSYQADLLIDGDTSTWWAEGEAGDGAGSWIEFDAEAKQSVSSVTIMGGCNESEDLYWRNGRPRQVTISFDDGSHTGTTLSDTPFAWQTITLDEPVQTESVRITIDSAYSGSATSDTCVSEIEIR